MLSTTRVVRAAKRAVRVARSKPALALAVLAVVIAVVAGLVWLLKGRRRGGRRENWGSKPLDENDAKGHYKLIKNWCSGGKTYTSILKSKPWIEKNYTANSVRVACQAGLDLLEQGKRNDESGTKTLQDQCPKDKNGKARLCDEPLLRGLYVCMNSDNSKCCEPTTKNGKPSVTNCHDKNDKPGKPSGAGVRNWEYVKWRCWKDKNFSSECSKVPQAGQGANGGTPPAGITAPSDTGTGDKTDSSSASTNLRWSRDARVSTKIGCSTDGTNENDVFLWWNNKDGEAGGICCQDVTINGTRFDKQLTPDVLKKVAGNEDFVKCAKKFKPSLCCEGERNSWNGTCSGAGGKTVIDKGYKAQECSNYRDQLK
jgi:hypothetical protein